MSIEAFQPFENPFTVPHCHPGYAIDTPSQIGLHFTRGGPGFTEAVLGACPEELLPATQQPAQPQATEGSGLMGSSAPEEEEAWTLELPADASDAEVVRLLSWFREACGCSEGGQGDER